MSEEILEFMISAVHVDHEAQQLVKIQPGGDKVGYFARASICLRYTRNP
jgi:hypothetical protein